MTINKGRLSLITIILIVLTVWVGLGSQLPFQPFCPFHRITGLPCPGCGGIRATQLLLSGDVKSALLTNPLSIITCVIIFVLIIWAWIDIIRKNDSLNRFLNRKWKKSTIVIIFLIIISNWIWNIYKEFS